MLLGAVVSSTDAAAVFATLRFTHIRRRLARTLEAESGGNDPMAIALTLGLIAWIEQPALRARRPRAAGRPADRARPRRRRRARRRGDAGSSRACPQSIGAFAPVASLAAAALAFGAADVDRRQRLPRRLPRRPRRRQHAVALPAPARRLPRRHRVPRAGRAVHRARPARLPERAARRSRPRASRSRCCSCWSSRPAAVWASTAFSDFTASERLLLGWAGLRGAVPIVLATFALSSHVPHSTRSSTPSSSSSSSRRSCRERRSSGWPEARPALAGAAHPRASTRGRAPRASSI